jgi:hypothetical protein
MCVTKLPDHQLTSSLIWPSKVKHELKGRLQIFAHNCSAQPGQNGATWQTPSKPGIGVDFVTPLYRQEPVAVLTSLHSLRPNASVKQYECGGTQPLLCMRQ